MVDLLDKNENNLQLINKSHCGMQLICIFTVLKQNNNKTK